MLGAVGAIKDIANPVQLSKRILEDTPHCLIFGEGASKFAKRIGYPVLEDPTELIAKEGVLKSYLEPNVKYQHNVRAYFNEIIKSKDLRGLEEEAIKMSRNGDFNPEKGSICHDTVGAVALDANGNLACATSTGTVFFAFLNDSIFVRSYCGTSSLSFSLTVHKALSTLHKLTYVRRWLV